MIDHRAYSVQHRGFLRPVRYAKGVLDMLPMQIIHVDRDRGGSDGFQSLLF